MKYKYSIVCAIIIGFAFSSFGQTDTNTNSATRDQAVQSLKQPTATNINELVIQALSGVKDASGEIYNASKEAIHTSVDFVTKEAPDVVKQFLVWKFCEAVIYASMTILGMAVFWYIVRRVYLWEKDEGRGELFATPVLCIIGGVVSLFLLGGVEVPNVMTAVEIKVAPKIYIIEYVVNTIHPQQHQ